MGMLVGLVLALLAVVVTPRPASAGFLDSFTTATSLVYSFVWKTVANWSSTSASGSMETASGTASGTGTLVVSATPSGYTFAFEGPGGQGWGTTNGAGLIVNEGPFKIGSIEYPYPAGVPKATPGDFVSQGQLVLTPGHVDLRYTDITHTNTFGVSADVTFSGSGDQKSTVTASEPLGVAVVAVGLVLAARLRRRRA